MQTTRELCKRCYGEGMVLGGGMIMCACPICEGIGHTYQHHGNVEVKIDKRSQTYKDSVKKIQALHPDLSTRECREILDFELEKKHD